MTIETDFDEMMNDTVTIAPKSSVDNYGKRSWGTAVSYQSRVSYVTRLMKDSEGRERTSSGRAYIYGVANVDPSAKITLPNGTTPVIINIDTVTDQFGQHHTTVHFE